MLLVMPPQGAPPDRAGHGTEYLPGFPALQDSSYSRREDCTFFTFSKPMKQSLSKLDLLTSCLDLFLHLKVLPRQYLEDPFHSSLLSARPLGTPTPPCSSVPHTREPWHCCSAHLDLLGQGDWCSLDTQAEPMLQNSCLPTDTVLPETRMTECT